MVAEISQNMHESKKLKITSGRFFWFQSEIELFLQALDFCDSSTQIFSRIRSIILRIVAIARLFFLLRPVKKIFISCCTDAYRIAE